MRAAVLLCLVALPGCLVGRNLYSTADDSIETAATANDPSLPEGGPSQANPDSGAAAPEGDATGRTTPEPPSADAGADASRPDAAPQEAGTPMCVAGGALEREPNDTSPTAEAMRLGVTCGELASATDSDWFTFDSGDDQKGVVVLSLQADGDDGRWVARVYSPGTRAQKYTLTRPAR